MPLLTDPAAQELPAVAVLRWAVAQKGKPYVWNGRGPNGYDCSGLVEAAYEQANIDLPKGSDNLWTSKLLTSVNDKSKLLPGDILFTPSPWSGRPDAPAGATGDKPHGHVALFIGGHTVVEAASSDTGVIVDQWSDERWKEIDGVRRAPGLWDDAEALKMLGESGTGTDNILSELAGGLVPGGNQIIDAAGGVKGGIDAVGNFFNLALWWTHPENWMRIGLGFAGAWCLIFGIWLVSKEIRD